MPQRVSVTTPTLIPPSGFPTWKNNLDLIRRALLQVQASLNTLMGTTTNDNAVSGEVGEFVTNSSGTVSLATTTQTVICSISLTAGDWEVRGNVTFNPAPTTTVTAFLVGSSATATVAGGDMSVQILQAPFTTGAQQEVLVGTRRYSLAATTTINLIGQLNFGTSTATATGTIVGRRVR